MKWPKLHRSWIHIPNGAFLGGDKRQRARQMARLKAEGLQPGAADYLLAHSNGKFPGMFLEIKALNKKPTKDQIEFLDDMRSEGYCACWAAGVDECWHMIEWYMNGCE